MTIILLSLPFIMALICIEFMLGGLRLGKWTLRALIWLLCFTLGLYGFVAHIQYLANCPSLLSSCYSDTLPADWFTYKLLPPLSLLCWMLFASVVLALYIMRFVWQKIRDRTSCQTTGMPELKVLLARRISSKESSG